MMKNLKFVFPFLFFPAVIWAQVYTPTTVQTTTNQTRPLIIKGHNWASELISLQNNGGQTKWHLNLNGGLNFVETGAFDYRLFLQTGGNVGIGTNTPTSKLHVNGDIAWGSFGSVISTQGNSTGLELRGNGASSFIDFSNDVAADFDARLMLNANNNISLVGTDVGGQGVFFGIGMYDPTTTLDINGQSGTEAGLGILKIMGNGDANLRLGVVNGQYSWIQSHGSLPVHINRVGNNTILNELGGNVGIGTSNLPTQNTANGDLYRLFVKGGIKTEEIKVELCSGTWCDYVFEEDYQLLSLSEVETHIEATGHLHNIQSAAELEENGLELKSMTVNQQEKIEEIYLHMIAMDKRVKQLEKENKALKILLNHPKH